MNQEFIISIFMASAKDYMFSRVGMEKPNVSRGQVVNTND